MNNNTQQISKTRNIPSHLSEMIQRFAKETKQLLQENIIAEYLFGSYTTNKQTSQSDIDILIIVHTLTPEMRRQMSGLATEYSLEYNVYISPVIKARDIWEKNKHYQTLFYQEVMQHGVPL
jgi:predicted nucleotidyltransferase